ncbi:DUF2141 domain-containing protein [Cyclobacterium jeungdonense]|uniref:DUF2141 domain-containing protein n=1 Tax=Cyclobacterium jeungdonense TaxID=708087 RepID=A0ABT8C0K4_9BACT|nr:DUF2141 domain-containing protein [Cyclobacterium jeungdonense]MDN3686304.1 DUF2141 domain-containing protein [Cyclobacterium jeungdonense]
MKTDGNNTVLKITVHIPNETEGLVQLLVFNSPSGFPDRPAKAIRSKSERIKSGKAVFRIAGLKEGFYALSAFHDADEDGRMRKSLFGIPKDAYGFSNDAREAFSAPSFKDASIYLPATGTLVEFSLK